jgi:isopentenyl-diphosphate delta-isomerase
MDEVIIVDGKDQVIGSMEKLEAHKKGVLHRAFSVFIFNSSHQLLLQKRALGKYHSGGLWTNTCCSHPQPGEDTRNAAARRLKEEMGLTAQLKKAFSFQYKVKFENGLAENEFDHVFVGLCDMDPNPDPREVADWKYVDLNFVIRDVAENPELYSYWFKELIPKINRLSEQKYFLIKDFFI